MIPMLRAGMRVRLPSGNIVMLLRPEGASWLCAYEPNMRQRGEVELSMLYLRKFGNRCDG